MVTPLAITGTQIWSDLKNPKKKILNIVPYYLFLIHCWQQVSCVLNFEPFGSFLQRFSPAYFDDVLERHLDFLPGCHCCKIIQEIGCSGFS